MTYAKPMQYLIDNKKKHAVSVLSLTENTQRYKSLTGFAIFPCGSDIRLRLAICPAGREGIYIISHWSEATIYRTSKASISRLLANISPNKKRADIQDFIVLRVCSFCRYKGLGLAHICIYQNKCDACTFIKLQILR